MKYWIAPTNGTPDLFSVNSISKLNGIPFQTFEATNYKCENYQQAHSGNNFMGFLAGFGPKKNSFANEYLQCKLVTPLKKHRSYRITFYLNFNKCSELKLKNIGIYLSKDSIRQYYPNAYEYPMWSNFTSSYPAQVITTSESQLDTEAWTKVEGILKATGTEQWLTIGHFYQDLYFNSAIPTDTDTTIFSYYYIDDVSVIEIPTIGGVDSVCLGDNAFLSSPYSQPVFWSSDREGKIILSSDSVYTFIATKTNWYYLHSQSTLDSLKVTTIYPPTATVSNDTFICPGATIELYASSSGNKVEWNNSIVKNSIQINTPGTYHVEISNNYCSTAYSISVSQAMNPTLPNLNRSLQLCSEESQRLQVDLPATYSYKWTTDQDTSHTKYFYSEGKYVFLVSNTMCHIYDSIYIADLCNPHIYVPNTFTPTGYNRTFKVYISNLTSSKLSIFNSWGQKLFESSDLIQEWDGTYMNTVCPQATYFFFFTGIVETKEGFKEINLKGTIYLLR